MALWRAKINTHLLASTGWACVYCIYTGWTLSLKKVGWHAFEFSIYSLDKAANAGASRNEEPYRHYNHYLVQKQRIIYLSYLVMDNHNMPRQSRYKWGNLDTAVVLVGLTKHKYTHIHTYIRTYIRTYIHKNIWLIQIHYLLKQGPEFLKIFAGVRPNEM